MTILLPFLVVFTLITGSVALMVASMQLAGLVWRRAASADIVHRAEDLLRAQAGPRSAW